MEEFDRRVSDIKRLDLKSQGINEIQIIPCGVTLKNISEGINKVWAEFFDSAMDRITTTGIFYRNQQSNHVNTNISLSKGIFNLAVFYQARLGKTVAAQIN